MSARAAGKTRRAVRALVGTRPTTRRVGLGSGAVEAAMSARAAFFLALWVACASAAAQTPASPAPAGAPPAAASAPADNSKVQPTRGEDKDVIQATERLLKLIDAGQYGDAWDGAAVPLKSSVTRKGFVEGLGKLRAPLGKVASRTPGRFARAHQLPGGPDGDYALVTFDTKFTNGKTAEEQVVWLLEPPDIWRVSGYFIR